MPIPAMILAAMFVAKKAKQVADSKRKKSDEPEALQSKQQNTSMVEEPKDYEDDLADIFKARNS